jgi:hypothetical protein
MANLKFGKQRRNTTPKTRKFADIQCSSTPGVTCRWLHLCLKQRPNAKVTKLEPIHVCRDDEQNELTDASFFKVLRRAWKMRRTWKDLILFKLARIEFIKVQSLIFLLEFLLTATQHSSQPSPTIQSTVSWPIWSLPQQINMTLLLHRRSR